MNKYLPLSILLGWCLSTSSYALGLGQLEIHSRLNQPFDASIKIFALGTTALSDVEAVIASDQYTQYNKTTQAPPPNTSNFDFETTRNNQGEPVIQVTSNENMTDLYIDVLLELTWPQGKALRSYTALLDPPNYSVNNTTQSKIKPVVLATLSPRLAKVLPQRSESQASYTATQNIEQKDNKQASEKPITTEPSPLRQLDMPLQTQLARITTAMINLTKNDIKMQQQLSSLQTQLMQTNHETVVLKRQILSLGNNNQQSLRSNPLTTNSNKLDNTIYNQFIPMVPMAAIVLTLLFLLLGRKYQISAPAKKLNKQAPIDNASIQIRDRSSAKTTDKPQTQNEPNIDFVNYANETMSLVTNEELTDNKQTVSTEELIKMHIAKGQFKQAQQLLEKIDPEQSEKQQLSEKLS
ncbi:MAG: hypothetical protein V3V61_00820 [Gammaproteobacteria bacterium]